MQRRKIGAVAALAACLTLPVLLTTHGNKTVPAGMAASQEPRRRPGGEGVQGRVPQNSSCESLCVCSAPCYKVCRDDDVSTTCGAYGGTPCGTCVQKRSVEILFTSPKRRNVQGKDGGHNERYCDAKDKTYYPCQGGSTKWHMDGLQLVAEKMVFVGGNLPFDRRSRMGAIEGPYQLQSGKWEWRDDRFNEWTYRPTTLLDIYYEGVTWSGTTTHAASYYSLRWDELDPHVGNDDFDWSVNFIPYVEECFRKAPQPNILYIVSTDNVIRNTNDPSKFFCDSRGCRDGEFEVRFDVKCIWRPQA